MVDVGNSDWIGKEFTFNSILCFWLSRWSFLGWFYSEASWVRVEVNAWIFSFADVGISSWLLPFLVGHLLMRLIRRGRHNSCFQKVRSLHEWLSLHSFMSCGLSPRWRICVPKIISLICHNLPLSIHRRFIPAVVGTHGMPRRVNAQLLLELGIGAQLIWLLLTPLFDLSFKELTLPVLQVLLDLLLQLNEVSDYFTHVRVFNLLDVVREVVVLNCILRLVVGHFRSWKFVKEIIWNYFAHVWVQIQDYMFWCRAVMVLRLHLRNFATYIGICVRIVNYDLIYGLVVSFPSRVPHHSRLIRGT
jgi:hypothetical protein